MRTTYDAKDYGNTVAWPDGGSELNVAGFAHITFNRHSWIVHILMRSWFVALFGKVMPFWLGASTLLNLLPPPFEHLNKRPWQFAAIAATIQVVAVLFSIVGPVPINKRIARWAPEALPGDWTAHEHRWDLYHLIRTCGVVVAFAILVLSVGAR